MRTADLAELIAGTIAGEKAYNVPRLCIDLGLAAGDEAEAFRSKRLYALQRLEGLDLPALSVVGEKLLARVEADELSEALLRLRETGFPGISSITRQRILDFLALRNDIGGRRGILELLSSVWPLTAMPSSDYRFTNAADDISQHMVLNNDWTISYLFDYLELRTCSQQRFFAFLAQIVHPLSLDGATQTELVQSLNALLEADGFELSVCEVLSGFSVYGIRQRLTGVAGRPKNLIFASNGPKPDLVLADAINNDVRIVRNQENCLVYDQPFAQNGLGWSGLVDWWNATEYAARLGKGERTLYRRLSESLGSEPERRLFKQYYRRWRKELGDRLPALIPQVYLHFDPHTMRDRLNVGVLPRQRMDFLILLSSHERVVIEVDGKQHYAEGERASPEYYGRMVAADRDLRLLGYEVYRFGAAELLDTEYGSTIDQFFSRLFAKHRVVPSDLPPLRST